MRTFFLIGFFVLIAFGITTCRNKEHKIVFHNDCEHLRGWNNTNLPYTEITAHSLNCASYTDTNNQFSVGFFYPYKKITSKKIKKITISAWVYLSYFACKGDLVFAIVNKELSKFYKYEKISLQEKVIDYKSWIKIEGTYFINDTISSDTYFQLYVYNTGLYPIYADDFSLTFYD